MQPNIYIRNEKRRASGYLFTYLLIFSTLIKWNDDFHVFVDFSIESSVFLWLLACQVISKRLIDLLSSWWSQKRIAHTQRFDESLQWSVGVGGIAEKSVSMDKKYRRIMQILVFTKKERRNYSNKIEEDRPQTSKLDHFPSDLLAKFLLLTLGSLRKW